MPYRPPRPKKSEPKPGELENQQSPPPPQQWDAQKRTPAVSETNNLPILDWLLRKHPDTPKSRAKQWIVAGRVSVNGVVIRRPHQCIADPGDNLSLGGRHATTLDCGSGWQIHPRVTLLYLDCTLAIVNKGPGLISVPASEGDLSALSILADFLSGDLKAQVREVSIKSLPPAYRRLQPLPVHRLDQHTSGVFCMATNPTARHHLIEQLKAHSMKREYVAFVNGRASVPKGVWRQWLQLSRDELRQNVIPETQAVAAGAEACEAITHYEVVDEYSVAGGTRFVSKLRLRLETGRKHQIRVQAANAGLPLIGDRTYNPEVRDPDAADTRIDFPRQALHAEVLTLEHPDQPGTRMSWTAEMPKDLRRLEHDLRAGRL
ncbi:MAG: RluA family pseudouridine synthase [Verrucomicrobia bacterium]|nr:RluA family pseudouridine synthase [Verrucomicrobiota bacterium]